MLVISSEQISLFRGANSLVSLDSKHTNSHLLLGGDEWFGGKETRCGEVCAMIGGQERVK